MSRMNTLMIEQMNAERERDEAEIILDHAIVGFEMLVMDSAIVSATGEAQLNDGSTLEGFVEATETGFQYTATVNGITHVIFADPYGVVTAINHQLAA